MATRTKRSKNKDKIEVDYSILLKPTSDQFKVLDLLKTYDYGNIRLAEQLDIHSDVSVLDFIESFLKKYEYASFKNYLYNFDSPQYKHYPLVVLFKDLNILDERLPSYDFSSLEDYFLYLTDLQFFTNDFRVSYSPNEFISFNVRFTKGLTYKGIEIPRYDYLLLHEIQTKLHEITGIPQHLIDI